MVKEKLLLLSITYPEFSKRYYYRVCVAGITDSGELRRVYPVPLNLYLTNINIFKKYNWIEYDRLEKGDYRKESYKANLRNVKILGIATHKEIGEIIKDSIENLENLTEFRDKNDLSLGFVKPDIDDITLEISEERIRMKRKLTSQLQLFTGTVGDFLIPEHIKINFSCNNTNNCTGHNIICEDIKCWEYFKEKQDKKIPLEIYKTSIEREVLTPLKTDSNLIMMMGTHFQFKTWLVISLISPSFLNNTIK